LVATERMAEKIRDYVSTNVTLLAIGSNKAVSTPNTSDTVLDYEVLRLSSSSTDTDTDRTVKFQHVVSIEEGNGLAFKEVGLYSDSKTALEDGEDVSDWSAGGDAAITADSTIYQIGSKSMKIAITYSTGTGTATKTTSIGDISSITGVSSGTPTGGTVSMKVRPNSLTDFTSITYKIGSSASDYASKTVTLSGLTEDTWSGFNIDLTDASITGTPDWTAVDYQQIVIVATDDCDLYVDDVWVSENISSRNTVPIINKTSFLEVIYETVFTVVPE